MARIPRTLAAVLMTGALTAGYFVVASPANAATCPTTRSPRIDGGEAHWKLSCRDGDLRITGWVDDTRADAKCAVVRIDPHVGSLREIKACGSGARETFDETFYSTDTANVTLFLR
ncbi:hypothetical protein [Streptomyces hydrogenans]|uniref:hypothetical protein n=1 Tax=Streptomyces hydrogenans TaxID=1873719 RepID=UPI0034226AEF